MKGYKILTVLVISILLISVTSIFAGVKFVDGKVVFTFKAEANAVYLAGNFNNWNPTAWPMKLIDGVWTYEVELKPGSYQYKYVIDGKTWKEDPEAPAYVDDGFGGKNGAFTLTTDGKILGEQSTQQSQGKKYKLNEKRENTIFVDPDGYVVIRINAPGAKHVFIAGSFNNWNDKDTECYYVDAGWWEAVLELTPGIYEYKFIIDGNWTVDPNAFAYTDDGFGGKNAVLEVAKEGGKLIVRAPQNATKSEGVKEEKTQEQVTTTERVKPGLSIDGNKVVFAVKKENAQEAYLAGSFNSWDPKALKMQLVNGYWVASLILQPGTYEYKYVFVIGGNYVWEEDPNAPGYKPDGFGGKNGIFKLVQKDGKLAIEEPQQAASGLPVKGAYIFKYEFKTDSTKLLVGSTFFNKLTLLFQPSEEISLGITYDGANLSKANVKLYKDNYGFELFYNSPFAYVSDYSLYSIGKNTGVVFKYSLGNYLFITGAGYENGKLPWIVGIDGKMYKLYVSQYYFSNDIAIVGEISLPETFGLSICGKYSLDQTFFVSAAFSLNAFGIYASFDGANIYGEISTVLGKDTITLGGGYEISYSSISVSATYATEGIEYYIDTDLSNVDAKVTFIMKDKKLSLGLKTDISDVINRTYLSLFGEVNF